MLGVWVVIVVAVIAHLLGVGCIYRGAYLAGRKAHRWED